MINDSAEKAEILSAQVFAVKDAGTMPDKGGSHHPTIPDIDVTFNGIRNLLLKLNKSTGLDNVHGAFLKHTAYETAPLLAHLLKQSFRNGIVPVS